MDIKKAKAKLDSISKSTAIKHPKVLVAELCVVVKFLLDEVDRIKAPTFTTLTSSPKPNIKVIDPSRQKRPLPSETFPLPEPPPSELPYDSSLEHRRLRNAGDAE